MYVSIRRYNVTQPDEVISHVEQDFVSRISAIPDFAEYYLVKTGEQELTAISFFDSREGAEESNQVAAEWVGTKFESTVAGPAEVVCGAVALWRGK